MFNHTDPWFELWDDKLEDVAASNILSNVKSINQIDKEKAQEAAGGMDDIDMSSAANDETINIPQDKIHKIKHPDNVEDGDW